VNAGAFLSELRRRDIQVWALGDELRCNAPVHALTPELRDELRRRKNEILQFLASARALAGQQRAIVPLQRSGERAPVFAVPGHNGDVFCYRALAQCLAPDQPFFGLQPPGLDGEGEPFARVEDLAGYFARQIRAFRPHGPCIIAGYCAGGTIAFELAQQLLGGGAAVRFVALFGSPYPAYFSLRTQLRLHVAHQAERISRHARELAARSWAARRQYLAAKLAQRKARRDAARAASHDPVVLVRTKVERATVCAVRRYKPRYLPGRVSLFLPGREALRSGRGELCWRSVAQVAEEYFGPGGCDSHDMLREPAAAAFAELFRRCENAR
jgi:thioesterase domain-containing protein